MFKLALLLVLVFMLPLVRHVCHIHVKRYSFQRGGAQPCTSIVWKCRRNVPCERPCATHLLGDATLGKADTCPAWLSSSSSLACTAGATGSCPFLLGHALVFSISQGLASISLLTLRGAYSQKLSQ